MRKCKVFVEKSEYGYSAFIGDTPLEPHTSDFALVNVIGP